jgi:hypothetical protein
MKEIIEDPFLGDAKEPFLDSEYVSTKNIAELNTKEKKLSKFNSRNIKRIGVIDNTPKLKNKFKTSKSQKRINRRINK